MGSRGIDMISPSVRLTFCDWQSLPLSASVIQRPRASENEIKLTTEMILRRASQHRRALGWACGKYSTRLIPPVTGTCVVRLTEILNGIDTDGSGALLDLEYDTKSGSLVSLFCVQHRPLHNPRAVKSSAKLEEAKSRKRGHGSMPLKAEYRFKLSSSVYGKKAFGIRPHSNVLVIAVMYVDRRIEYLDPTTLRVLKVSSARF